MHPDEAGTDDEGRICFSSDGREGYRRGVLRRGYDDFYDDDQGRTWRASQLIAALAGFALIVFGVHAVDNASVHDPEAPFAFDDGSSHHGVERRIQRDDGRRSGQRRRVDRSGANRVGLC